MAAVPAGLLGAYATTMGRAGMRAVREPSPRRLQGLVGAGVLGLMPLEGALIAARSRRRPRVAVAGAAVTALWPLARSLARRRAVT